MLSMVKLIRTDDETWTEIRKFGIYGEDMDDILRKIIALAKKQVQLENEMIQ